MKRVTLFLVFGSLPVCAGIIPAAASSLELGAPNAVEVAVVAQPFGITPQFSLPLRFDGIACRTSFEDAGVTVFAGASGFLLDRNRRAVAVVRAVPRPIARTAPVPGTGPDRVASESDELLGFPRLSDSAASL